VHAAICGRGGRHVEPAGFSQALTDIPAGSHPHFRLAHFSFLLDRGIIIFKSTYIFQEEIKLMKRTTINVAILVAAALVLGSCNLFGPAATTVAVNGTIDLTSVYVTTAATVQVTNGSATQTFMTPIPAAGLAQSLSFSLSDLPTGTYDVEVTFTADNNPYPGTYSINSALPVDFTPSGIGSGPCDWTVTIPGVDIQDNTTVAIVLSGFVS
jgi:hypothetical protein